MADTRRPAETSIVVEDDVTQPRSRVSWGAVLAGTLVALMVMLLVNLLTLGFGLRSVDPAGEANPLSGVGTGAMIGLIVANVLALFAGGWTAGRLANKPRGTDATLHGILTWGLATLVGFWLLSSAVGQLVSGVTSVVGQGLSAVSQGISSVAPDAAQAVEDALADQSVSIEEIRQEARDLTGAGAAGDGTTAGLVERFFTQEGQVDRQEVVDALTQNTELSAAQAEQRVGDWEQRYQEAQTALEEAQQQLEQAAQQASDAIGSAALWAFFGLLIGAAIAIAGSLTGRPKTMADAKLR